MPISSREYGAAGGSLKVLVTVDGSACLLVNIPASAAGGDIYFHRDCVVERKGSLEELSGNLTGERERFEKEFLKAGNDGCKVYLMVEAPGGGYSDISPTGTGQNLSPLPIWLR